MKYQKLQHYTSQPRLDRFLIACANSRTKAQKLYKINISVAQAFYPVYNLFEVFLRNELHYQLCAHFANNNWIINEQVGFMSNHSLAPSRYYLRNCVSKASQKIVRNGGVVSAGKLIAEQSFGFWTSLFDPHHYSLIGGCIIHAFPHKPAHINRSILSQKLTAIRDFRNRIYHNEPVCFRGNAIDFTLSQQVKNDIREIMAWMDADIDNYVSDFDKINSRINAGNRL